MKQLWYILIIFQVSTASATLIDYDTYTFDTATSSDWLDLTLTQPYTVKEISTLLRTTYDEELGFVPHNFEGGGWRFANRDEVINLFTSNIGSSFGIHSLETVEGTNAQNLLDLLDPTITGYGRRSAVGYVYDDIVNLAKLDEETLISTKGYYYVESAYRDREYSWDLPSISGVGTFLVRDNIIAVPIPASLPLFLLGLFTLIYRATNAKSCIDKYHGV